jgi:hypothetical protein
MENPLDKLKIDNPLDKLNDVKAQLTDVQGQADALKAKGAALKQKVIDLGIGGGAVLLLGALTQLMFPWWVSSIAAFWVGFWVADSPSKSYLYGFAAMMLMWTVFAAIQSSANGGIVTTAFSNIFGGKISGAQLIGATGFIGGIVGGFSAMSGTYLRQIFKKDVA